jgi:hypothetical protein
MSHHPLAFSHLVDPLDADDWLKVIEKKLDITQCNDREKVLYASERLKGTAPDWCVAFTAAHADAYAITWQEFQENFHAHHIPLGITKLEKKNSYPSLKEVCPLVSIGIVSPNFLATHQRKSIQMRSAKSDS